MHIRFKSRKLEKLYTDGKGAQKYPPPVIDAFFDLMATIVAADSPQDLRSLVWLHFEQLKGNRTGDRSLILHGPWRLEITIEQDNQRYVVTILDISKHYE